MTYAEIAASIDHLFLRPDATDDQLFAEIDVVLEHFPGVFLVRPTDVDAAVRQLDGSGVAVASVVAYPHGSATTGTKLYETRDLLRRGCQQIETVIHLGRLASRQFQYVENELLQMAEACHEKQGKLRVMLECSLLTEEQKLVACKIAKRSSVDWITATTGTATLGATQDDVRLLVRKCQPYVQVKVGQGVQNLDQLLELRELGVTRFGTTRTGVILKELRERLAKEAEQAPSGEGEA
ncbi:MAG: deoxyribose-phosphate aldolase [Bryobacteraceae bacterium]|nr:deoxyribose-phosphate aldolase [Bryobacteraceae bacterium]